MVDLNSDAAFLFKPYCSVTAVSLGSFEILIRELTEISKLFNIAQVTKKMPTVTIDKTDGCMIYLSRDALDASIISAKSSEMNILVPSADDGDYVSGVIVNTSSAAARGACTHSMHGWSEINSSRGPIVFFCFFKCILILIYQ